MAVDQKVTAQNYYYADTVSTYNGYADTIKTTRTLLENFEGFSQIPKEQSGKISYLGEFTCPIAII